MLTSQRLCDVVLQAFEACACSQGCMNNFLFGDATFGYYETIAGGSGAGPAYDGTSGVGTPTPSIPFHRNDTYVSELQRWNGDMRTGAHSHDQHTNHGPGNFGEKV